LEGAFSAPDAPNEANHFGSALEMSGSTIVAGADTTDEPGKADVGAVYSWERDAAGKWSLTQIFRYSDEPANTGVGRVLALDGNTLLVPVVTATSGRVIVYERTAPGVLWTQSQTLSGDQADEWFGKSVALRGDIAVVGAEQSGAGVQNQDRAGAAYVFTRTGPGAQWTHAQKITAPASAGLNKNFGSDVELDGTWLTIGARGLSQTAGQSGATFVYSGAPGSYAPVQTLAPDSPSSSSQGFESTYLRDGLLVIGSPDERNPANSSQIVGGAFAYDLSAGTVGSAQKLSSSSSPRFGASAAAAGDLMIVGAPSRNSQRGTVYFWDRTAAGSPWTLQVGVLPNPTTLEPDSFFGERLAMGPGRIAVAAPGKRDGTVPGNIYVYRDGAGEPFVSAGTSPATHIGTYRAWLNAVVRSRGVNTTFYFDYGKTTAYELGSVTALPETINSVPALKVRRDLDGLQFPRLESNTLYHYRVRGGGAVGLDTTFTTASFDPLIGEALESPSLNWESYGEPRWQRETATTWDGSDAMKTGAIPANFRTMLETTVTGPGTLSFRWKVSSTPTYHVLTFRDNETIVKSISGNVNWTQESVPVSDGTHRITWAYEKAGGSPTGLDAGWVDTVKWTSDSAANAYAQWRSSVFSASQLANPAISGAEADPDGDGLKNVVEAHFGSSPLQPGAAPLTVTAAGATLTLRWPEANPTPGTVAIPEWSPDGTTWLASGQSQGNIPARTMPVSQVEGNLKQAALPASGLARAFLRLRIAGP
jgi:hypothetical protein